MSFIRDVIFSNWRNKGVALFFSVIIWGLAFQKEFQEEVIPIHVVLLPKQTDQVVLRQLAPKSDDSFKSFNGTIRATVRGTRKQVLEFKNNVLTSFEIRVDGNSEPDAEPTKYTFSKDDFRFKSFSFIEMDQFEPPFVRLTFDVVDTREMPVQSFITVPLPGLEVERESVTPTEVTVSGPSSLLDKIRVVAEPVFGEDERDWAFRGSVPLKIVPGKIDEVVVGDLVTIVGSEDGKPTMAALDVRLRAKIEQFEQEQVPIRFSTPPAFPFTIQFEDRHIQVLFRGPEQEIKRLKAQIEKPDFFLSVKIDIDGLTGTNVDQRTFTEGDLLLHGGYSRDVQILKHSKRDREGLGLWSYSLVPAQASKENEE
jgi:acylphosphatase